MDFLTHPHLFNHIYDIDALILPFASGKEGTFTLITTEGIVVEPGAEMPEAPATHTFSFTALPDHFMKDLASHPALLRQPEETQAALLLFMQENPTLPECVPFFGETYEGDFVRERVKEGVLEWLIDNNILPPSMRHVLPKAPTRAPVHSGKIMIETME
ncbi:MAG: hypothetical protein COY40_04770 [Alphaproteobacteria bacterium CG_4_10_14_0_8_um_filter_53_9]|nr:MAG: hypothetical protein COY40_04770 [Alphaproteobacteria bacterium CG_4_10_14_0_8_um_filter_53_9]